MSLTSEFRKSIEYWSEFAARVPPEERSSALHIVEGLKKLALKVSALEFRHNSKASATSRSKFQNIPERGDGTLH